MTKALFKTYKFVPTGTYPFDLEIIPIPKLKGKSAANSEKRRLLMTPHRAEFHIIIVITEGSYTHMVDFENIHCETGTWLFIKSGQIQSFDMDSDFDGYMIIFRPEFLSLKINSLRQNVSECLFALLPDSMFLKNEHEIGLINIKQMQKDLESYSSLEKCNEILRIHLELLLTRIYLTLESIDANKTMLPPKVQMQFWKFKKNIENRINVKYQVQSFADELGCSEKTLNRVVQQAVGKTAKEYIKGHLVLEVKRSLMHTDLTISEIAYKFGFDEITNFSKFFKREAGATPKTFRDRYMK